MSLFKNLIDMFDDAEMINDDYGHPVFSLERFDGEHKLPPFISDWRACRSKRPANAAKTSPGKGFVPCLKVIRFSCLFQ